jgi:hypothetical protein
VQSTGPAKPVIEGLDESEPHLADDFFEAGEFLTLNRIIQILAVEAVFGEPVSTRISLFCGKIQGNLGRRC